MLLAMIWNKHDIGLCYQNRSLKFTEKYINFLTQTRLTIFEEFLV